MTHDGKTNDATETEGPRRVRLEVLQEGLARQDREQAKVIRGWADELEAARAKLATVIVGGNIEGKALATIANTIATMRKTADTVEAFATELLKKLERGPR
jgi:delta 1-pyrroline-5-carboxylate dehydrogenase